MVSFGFRNNKGSMDFCSVFCPNRPLLPIGASCSQSWVQARHVEFERLSPRVTKQEPWKGAIRRFVASTRMCLHLGVGSVGEKDAWWKLRTHPHRPSVKLGWCFRALSKTDPGFALWGKDKMKWFASILTWFSTRTAPRLALGGKLLRGACLENRVVHHISGLDFTRRVDFL